MSPCFPNAYLNHKPIIIRNHNQLFRLIPKCSKKSVVLSDRYFHVKIGALAAQENYKKKTEGNEAIALYHKYYKRYAARVKVRQIKEQDFKKWKYEAIVKRDECSAGKITPAEFTEWLEACFPNRKKIINPQ